LDIIVVIIITLPTQTATINQHYRPLPRVFRCRVRQQNVTKSWPSHRLHLWLSPLTMTVQLMSTSVRGE